MEPCIMDRQFMKQEVIDNFSSLIWTERFYGDSDFEMIVPLNREMIAKLREGTFVCIDESDEPMIIETVSVEEGKLKVIGISLTLWLNNRFIRTGVTDPGPNHRKKVWKFKNVKAGAVMWTIVKEMCTSQSSYLNGPKTLGIGSVSREQELIIPGLQLHNYDSTGKTIAKLAVPFGPVYDALREIGVTYKVGMQILLTHADMDSYSLGFRTYTGVDRTTKQTVNPVVRFSSQVDSFSDLKEIRSIAMYKTLVYSFASGLEKNTSDPNTDPDTWLQRNCGVARRTKAEGSFTGFDLRAKLLLVEDIKIKEDLDEEDPESTLGGKRTELENILDNRAEKELKANPFISSVDGRVAATNMFKCGVDYNLGDIIEVEGLTGAIEISRVTEYIRAHDASGEKEYPTVVAVDLE
jgi:hypothetical protein